MRSISRPTATRSARSTSRAVALDRAQAAAAERGLTVEWLCADLDEDPERALPAGGFDLIVWVRYVHATLMPHLVARLAVGGTIVCEQHFATGAAGRGTEERGVSAAARRAAPLGAGPSRHATRTKGPPSIPTAARLRSRNSSAQDGVTAWRGTLISCLQRYAAARCGRSRYGCAAGPSVRCSARRKSPRKSRTRTEPERRTDARSARASRRDDSHDPRHRRQRLRPDQSRRRQGAVSLGEQRPRADSREASSRTSCCSPKASDSSRGCSTSRRARCARAASSPKPPSSPAATTPRRTASTSTCTSATRGRWRST